MHLFMHHFKLKRDIDIKGIREKAQETSSDTGIVVCIHVL